MQTLKGYYGVTSESSHSGMESLYTQLRATFGAHHHALCLILPCFGTPNLKTDGVPYSQAIHKRVHSIQTLEGYYGATSESSHSRMESLCTQLRASFGAHALDLILSCFGTPNLREENLIITLERRLTHAGFMKASYKRRERKGQSTKCKS